MPLPAGDKLGPYEILAPIGKGGMGEVYRARDPRLGRDVAVKVSAQQFTERFEREARAIAALNHTNVCHLYDVGPNYLVMELVEGETLSGPLQFDQALPILRQLIDGIEAAHEKNIVHRDLKPANIKITNDGVVKILDFGLAKAGASEPKGNPETSPTLTMGSTQAGTLLGTAAYMSPEQARGKTADKRSDVWSFGVVVYELLTGKRPFEGESVVETLGAVLHKEPDWTPVPARAHRLLKWCLEKDRKQRLQAIGDARRMLEDVAEAAAAAVPSHSRFKTAVLASIAAVAIVALGAISFIHFREQPPVAEVTRFQIPLPAGASFPNPGFPEEISPDGRKLAFAVSESGGMPRIWIRTLDSLEARPLPGTEVPINAQPFLWSWDSRFLAFLSPDHKLKKIDISGGPAQTLCEAADLTGGSWSPEGIILLGGGLQMPIMRVSEKGGTAVAVTALDASRQEIVHADPKFLPDGRHFLYLRASTSSAGIYVGSIDAKPAEQPFQPLLLNHGIPEYYVPPAVGSSGHLLFFREGAVLAQPFNASKLQLNGDPVAIAERVDSFPEIQGAFSASSNGVLTFLGSGAGAGTSQLTWLDRQGKTVGTVGEPAVFGSLALSPDGKQAAVSRATSQNVPNANLWLYDLNGRGAPARFTFDSSLDDDPVYSPDGGRIVFMSSRDILPNLYQKLTNSAKNEELLLMSDEPKFASSWSRDGFLAYTVLSKSKGDIWILPMDGKGKAMLFQGTEFNERNPQFSPDGHWIAYQSDAGGRNEVYVREFILGSDGKPEATPPNLVSTGGGSFPKWRDGGKELFYVSGDQKAILSVEIATKPSFQFSATKLSVPLPPGVNTFAVSGNGQRFLVAVPVTQNNAPRQFTIVQNWQAGLKK